jgi:Cu/Ag efflux protein CusF
VIRKKVYPVLLLAFLAGCAHQPPEKRYTMHGEVQALDPAGKTATIKAGKISGWMEAMTMEYQVKPEADFAKLHVGDQIDATVVVNDLKYYVTGVTVEPK